MIVSSSFETEPDDEFKGNHCRSVSKAESTNVRAVRGRGDRR